MVWQSIANSERGLRNLVRAVYSERFGNAARERIEAGLGEREREALVRALRSLPVGSDPLRVVDYLYLAQLPVLLVREDVWPTVRPKLRGDGDVKAKLRAAIEQIMPVRNEIAHVREVSSDRLQRASVACADVLSMIGASGA